MIGAEIRNAIQAASPPQPELLSKEEREAREVERRRQLLEAKDVEQAKYDRFAALAAEADRAGEMLSPLPSEGLPEEQQPQQQPQQQLQQAQGWSDASDATAPEEAETPIVSPEATGQLPANMPPLPQQAEEEEKEAVALGPPNQMDVDTEEAFIELLIDIGVPVPLAEASTQYLAELGVVDATDLVTLPEAYLRESGLNTVQMRKLRAVLQVRKRSFLSTFILKMIVLPRQARDKHRKHSKRGSFSRRISSRLALEHGTRWSQAWRKSREARAVQVASRAICLAACCVRLTRRKRIISLRRSPPSRKARKKERPSRSAMTSHPIHAMPSAAARGAIRTSKPFSSTSTSTSISSRHKGMTQERQSSSNQGCWGCAWLPTQSGAKQEREGVPTDRTRFAASLRRWLKAFKHCRMVRMAPALCTLHSALLCGCAIASACLHSALCTVVWLRDRFRLSAPHCTVRCVALCLSVCLSITA
eukprot:COSAG06_NODE_2583_length_6617_cov_18.685026_3_plen_476_part_00